MWDAVGQEGGQKHMKIEKKYTEFFLLVPPPESRFLYVKSESAGRELAGSAISKDDYVAYNFVQRTCIKCSHKKR